MTLFGKIMAILNVLAAGAFLFLAAQDYAVRQQWAYSVFKHRLANDGLPVDEDETDKEDRVIADSIDDELAQAITGDSTTRTLEQFLEQRKSELDRLLAIAKEEKRDLEAYIEVLLPLAPTERQAGATGPRKRGEWSRQQLLQLPLAKDIPVAELEELYKAQFKAVAQLNDREAKRQAIARLLVAWADVLPNAQERARRQKELTDRLAPDKRRHPSLDPEIQRLVRVLGPKQLTRELAAQASRLERWTFEVEDTRNRARTQFASVHTDLVNSLLPWYGALIDQERFLAWKTQQADDQEKNLARKQIAEVGVLTRKLEAEKLETAKLMERLTKTQDELHDVRVKLRDADIINQMRETLIRKLEGLAPR